MVDISQGQSESDIFGDDRWTEVILGNRSLVSKNLFQF